MTRLTLKGFFLHFDKTFGWLFALKTSIVLEVLVESLAFVFFQNRKFC